MLIAAAAVAVLFIAAWFRVPADRFGTLHVRVLFDGADHGRSFSSSEIVATPVLDQVCKANDLQRYMDFTTFKGSMFGLESNPDLELLLYKYQTKVSDPKLTPVDRARIEDEFRKKRESLRSAEFSLNLRRSERMKELPASLVTKILDDTLSEWARQVTEQKDALTYDIPVFSSNILQTDVVRCDGREDARGPRVFGRAARPRIQHNGIVRSAKPSRRLRVHLGLANLFGARSAEDDLRGEPVSLQLHSRIDAVPPVLQGTVLRGKPPTDTDYRTRRGGTGGLDDQPVEEDGQASRKPDDKQCAARADSQQGGARELSQ